MAGSLHANGFVTAIIVASVVVAALLGNTYEITSSTAIVYEPDVPALDGLLDGDDGFGSSVASLGDLDGNGIAELVVGAPGDNDFRPGTGATWILFLGPTGSLQSVAKVSALHGGLSYGVFGRSPGFGTSVAGTGDIDGDALPDFAVGGEYARGTRWGQGALWLLRSNSDGTVRSPSRIVGGVPRPDAGACATPTSTTTTTSTSTTTTTTLPGLEGLSLPLRDDRFGSSVSVTRDFESIAARVAVGARTSDDVACNSGAIWLIDLDGDGNPTGESRLAIDDLTDDARFGAGVAWLGDLDGNGTVELAVTAPGDFLTCGPDAGELWVLSIDAAGAVAAARRLDTSVLGPPAGLGSAFGRSVAALGDLDGDGVTEVAVTVDRALPPSSTSGDCATSVWVLFLAADGSVESAKSIDADDPILAGLIDSDGASSFTRDQSVAGVGDLNGDGVPDLAVGTPHYAPGRGEVRGAVFIVYLDGDADVVHARRFTDETSNVTTTSRFFETSTTSYVQDCGDAYRDGVITSSDALWALGTAIGFRVCGVCDIDCSGTVRARDALMILHAAIDQTPLVCECP